MTEPMKASSPLMRLEYPQHVAQFPTYDEAQGAVDYLADQRFAVENLMIVGTDLKLLERVTGRRTWGTVLGSGALSGVSFGLFVGLMLFFFIGPNTLMLLAGLALGIVFGLLSSGLAYAVSGGRRDFNSTRATVATSYEILAEHKVASQARELLTQRPGSRAAMFE